MAVQFACYFQFCIIPFLVKDLEASSFSGMSRSYFHTVCVPVDVPGCRCLYEIAASPDAQMKTALS